MSAQLRQTETFARQLFGIINVDYFLIQSHKLEILALNLKKDLSDAQDEKFGATKLLQKSVQAKEQPPPSI